LAAISCSNVFAQQIVYVPHPPGGVSDLIARSFARSNATVINLPSALSQAAHKAAVQNSQPFLVDVSIVFIDPRVHNLNHDIREDFDEFHWFITSSNVVVVSAKNSSEDLHNFLKNSKNTDLLYSISGTMTHLAALEFLSRFNLRGTPVPYRGGSSAIQSVISGDTVFHIGNYLGAKGLIDAKRLKIIATSETLDLKVRGYWGLAFPRNMPIGVRKHWRQIITMFVEKNQQELNIKYIHNTKEWMNSQDEFYQQLIRLYITKL
jgi:tripartite-type tricarboxylate transporter receptor subunit TctC